MKLCLFAFCICLKDKYLITNSICAIYKCILHGNVTQNKHNMMYSAVLNMWYVCKDSVKWSQLTLL